MIEIHRAAKETRDRLGEEEVHRFYLKIAEGQRKFLEQVDKGPSCRWSRAA